jgi:ABC-type Zn2+ transport system substrate-binding protein/surface adhesin
VRELKVPAVFVEPHLAHRAAVLERVAADAGVRVCLLHGDTFSPKATDYVQMMRWNAHELQRCLTKETP